MALFNNYSFNLGFLCGISNWFVPRFPFMPVWGGFNVWNNCGCCNTFPPPPPPIPVINIPMTQSSCQQSVFTPTPVGTQFNMNISMPSVWNNSNFTQSNNMPNFNIPQFPIMNNWQNSNWGNFQFPMWGNWGTASANNNKNLSTKFTVSGDNIIPEGYNKEKGERLGQTAWNGRNTVKTWYKGKYSFFSGKCATYTKKAIEKAGLGKYVHGYSGWENYQVLDKNPNFKEVAVPADYKKLPPGCVLLFRPGSHGYSSDYGHIEISLGDGRAVSDGVSNNMRKPDKVYVPV